MKEHLLNYINKAKSGNVRGLRILVEYFYALEIFNPIIKSKRLIVSVFGSARLKPDQTSYQDARKLGAELYKNGYAVLTGASKGIMQAANEGVVDGILVELSKKTKFKSKSPEFIKGSAEFKDKLYHYSAGLKISLPFEEEQNPYVGVFATFHYFMVRKFFFGTLSSAFIACEGGWGTRDELFEMLTLVQTGKAPLMPIIYISQEPKHLVDDIQFSIKRKLISPEDEHLLDIVSDYKKAVDIIVRFYTVVQKISYDNEPKIEIFLHKPLTSTQKKKMNQFITKKHPRTFESMEFHQKRIVLNTLNFNSYGVLRKLIDEIC